MTIRETWCKHVEGHAYITDFTCCAVELCCCTDLLHRLKVNQPPLDDIDELLLPGNAGEVPQESKHIKCSKSQQQTSRRASTIRSTEQTHTVLNLWHITWDLDCRWVGGCYIFIAGGLSGLKRFCVVNYLKYGVRRVTLKKVCRSFFSYRYVSLVASVLSN